MFIKPKKSLGQNFLIDRKILELIVDATEVKNKSILEIGPGTGNLTTFILKRNPKKVYVIEKDDELALSLKDKFTEEDKNSIQDKIKEVQEWYDDNMEASKEDYEEKQKELELVFSPIMMRVYQESAPPQGEAQEQPMEQPMELPMEQPIESDIDDNWEPKIDDVD